MWFCPQCERLYGEKSELPSHTVHRYSSWGLQGRITTGFLMLPGKEFLRFNICTLPHILSVTDWDGDNIPRLLEIFINKG